MFCRIFTCKQNHAWFWNFYSTLCCILHEAFFLNNSLYLKNYYLVTEKLINRWIGEERGWQIIVLGIFNCIIRYFIFVSTHALCATAMHSIKKDNLASQLIPEWIIYAERHSKNCNISHLYSFKYAALTYKMLRLQFHIS